MVAKGNKTHKKKPGRNQLKDKDSSSVNEHNTSRANKHNSQDVMRLLVHLGLERRSLDLLDFCRFLSFSRDNKNLSSASMHAGIHFTLSASSLNQWSFHNEASFSIHRWVVLKSLWIRMLGGAWTLGWRPLVGLRQHTLQKQRRLIGR